MRLTHVLLVTKTEPYTAADRIRLAWWRDVHWSSLKGGGKWRRRGGWKKQHETLPVLWPQLITHHLILELHSCSVSAAVLKLFFIGTYSCSQIIMVGSKAPCFLQTVHKLIDCWQPWSGGLQTHLNTPLSMPLLILHYLFSIPFCLRWDTYIFL